MSILDEVLPDSALDVSSWEKETKDKQAEGERKRKGYLGQYKLGEKEPDNVGMVTFLNEGLSLNFHTLKVNHGKKTVFNTILCLGAGCPLCHQGNEARRQGVFGLIDWLNTYEDKKTKKKVRAPQVKVLIKGLNTVKLIDMHRKKLGGSVVGKTFEVTRLGEGFQTTYHFMPEPDKVYDFSKTIPTEDGGQVFAIRRIEDWPKPIPGSVYDQKIDKLKPKEDLDWTNPKHVNAFLQLYFLNQDPAEYGKSAPSKATNSDDVGDSASEGSDDSDTPW